MCLILDTNAFGMFFDKKNSFHHDFEPVLKWVIYGKGKLIYGGTTYKKEMKKASKYIKLFTNLQRAGKLILVSDENVDIYENKLIKKCKDKDFDDPHLVAIIIESGCKIICTNDKRAIPFLKEKSLYMNMVDKPKIYQSKKNISLLSDKYISKICMPCEKLNKEERACLIG